MNHIIDNIINKYPAKSILDIFPSLKQLIKVYVNTLPITSKKNIIIIIISIIVVI